MSQDDFANEQDMIMELREWAEDNEWFDTTFIESLSDQLEQKGYLTNQQCISLESTHQKFIL